MGHLPLDRPSPKGLPIRVAQGSVARAIYEWNDPNGLILHNVPTTPSDVPGIVCLGANAQTRQLGQS